ncbi:hypothetical protein [Streptomyces sp. rh34]|uniref:hypothetical protein n=1 Tax=Streptomyces sp. rh34 TaxID=2034272 RepID=UPI0011808D94|nr:hypothetical protein [Streptomyces sp. rh34]
MPLTTRLVLCFSDGLGLSPTAAGLLVPPIFLARIVLGMVGSTLIGHWAPAWSSVPATRSRAPASPLSRC